MQNYIFSLGLNSAETLDFSMDFSTCHYNNSKPRRRCRPPKPQNIGDDICSNMFFGRMIGRKAGEQESDQRPYSDRSSADDAGFPCNLHKSDPERHYPHHSDTQSDCFFGRIKRGVSDIRHPSGECGEYNADQYHTCP